MTDEEATVEPVRLPDQLADELLRRILADNLRPGDRLPTEREIGEEFGVSRTVVREAVRSLVGRGVVKTRRGSVPVVAAVPVTAVTNSMRLYLHGNEGSESYQQVHEVRAAIEIRMAGLAAERATRVDVAHLRDQHELFVAIVARGEDASVADLEFHQLLAAATGNEFFAVVLESIVGLLLRVRAETLELPGAGDRTAAAHEAVLEAVAARDVERARSAMAAHLDQVLALWEGQRSHEQGDGR